MANTNFTRLISIICFLLILAVPRNRVCAQEKLDSIEASLMTCSPGTEVYSLYGHTALRIRNYTEKMDIVFNYGVFSFNAPHFLWRFTLGECDYEVDAIPYEYFIKEYELRGSSIEQQDLNLTPLEANRLLAFLAVNMRPENRTYRYNFLDNNCTTKVRDMIERAIDGEVVYAESGREETYRQVMHQYTADSPWAELGNDLLLGHNCDTLLSDRAAMFIPRQLMDYFDHAMVYDSLGNRRPLVCKTTTVVPAGTQVREPSFPLSPLVTSLVFLGVCLLIFAVERYADRVFWGVDMLLMTAQGVAGCLLCFMFFFSLHPTVDSNWQIWVLNPLPLLCMPWVVARARKQEFCIYHYVNAAVLVLFLVSMTWIPQDLTVIMAPLALSLLTRPVSYYLRYQKQ